MDGVEIAVTSTWADVGLAVIRFAREDPILFTSELVVVAVIAFFLLPRTTDAALAWYSTGLSKFKKQKDRTDTDDGDSE